LEAVRQGESMWGVDADGARPKRKVARERKSVRIDSDEEGDTDDEGQQLKDGGLQDNGDEDDEDESGNSKVKLDRVARAKQDLAFLGDDESDSD